MNSMKVTPGGVLRGDIHIPGDKSISHRAIMFASLADGVTRISGLLEGEDVLATIAAFRAMGVDIRKQGEQWIVTGAGIDGLKAPAAALDMGNSGTAMRLLSGVLAGQAFDTQLTGDASLSQRPMGRIADPLNAMGASIALSADGTPPIHIHGGQALRGMSHTLKVASAQVKSALLLAGLYAEGETTVIEPAPTRDHTERMLNGFGYEVNTDGNRLSLVGGERLSATDIAVPADISSSAFFMAGAAMTPGSEVVLKHIGINPTRTGVIEILKLMGADLSLRNEQQVGGEPVADIHVRGRRLQGARIPQHLVPLAIDEFPMLFVAAACADGETIVSGAEELRVKESDRIAVMEQGLQTLGIHACSTADGMIIEGGQPGGGVIDSHGDHRIAMAFAMCGLCADDEITIENSKNVATSFPDFVATAQAAGLKLAAIRA